MDNNPSQITPEMRRAMRLETYDKRGGAWVIFFISAAFSAFVAGSIVLQIDETARATGEVIAESRVQIIQSVDGGVIQEISVHEGEIVEPGQVLAQLADDRIRADVGEIRARLYAARIKAVRLKAEVSDLDELIFEQDLIDTFPDLVAIETALFKQRKQGLADELQTLETARNLAQQEQEMMKVLLDTGDTNQTEMLRVDRQLNEAEAAFVQRKNRFLEDVQSDLSAALDEIMQNEQVLARRDQELKSTTFTASVRGIVKNIRVTTIGGVLHSGEELMQIVPLDDTRIIEVKVLPKDIARVENGLPASIRLDPYDYTIWGPLDGKVTYVSADTIKEEGAGPNEVKTYYRVYVQPDGDITTTGRQVSIVPGMTAQIDIRTGSRSLFDYLLKPLRKTLTEAFREQ